VLRTLYNSLFCFSFRASFIWKKHLASRIVLCCRIVTSFNSFLQVFRTPNSKRTCCFSFQQKISSGPFYEFRLHCIGKRCLHSNYWKDKLTLPENRHESEKRASEIFQHSVNRIVPNDEVAKVSRTGRPTDAKLLDQLLVKSGILKFRVMNSRESERKFE
jgi:hypothetical protein